MISSVVSILGTNKQVLANGTYAIPQYGNITLSLPQNVDVNAAFQVNSVQFNTVKGILGSSGNTVIALTDVGAGNYLRIDNGTSGNQVAMIPDGIDPNIPLTIYAKGTGQLGFSTGSLSNQILVVTGSGPCLTYLNLPIANTSNTVTFPNASGTLALLDANSNLTANNFISGYATTATAASTTTLTVSSAYQQFFTGITTQTVQMPVTSTLALGQSWYIVNNSTGVVTVQSSGANTITTLAAGAADVITCILLSGTTAASWSSEASGASGVTSITGTTHQVIASSATGAVTLSLPQSIDTTSSPTFAALTLTAPLTLANGGTNANLTANNGGIVWSDASKLNILSGTATANLPLLSGSTATPAWGAYALSLGGALTTGGALTLSGAFATTFTITAGTSVTFPTSGTLLTSASATTGLTGTANEVLVNGTSGVATYGAITLTTPQSLATTAAFQVNSIKLNIGNGLGILGGNGNVIISNQDNGSANYIQVANAAANSPPSITATGSDPNVNLFLATTGTGHVTLYTAATTQPLLIYSGTSLQHITRFNFSNTGTTIDVTFPDSSFTVAGTTVALSGTGAASFNAYGPVFGGTTSTGALQSIAAGTSGQILISEGAGVLPAWTTSTYPATNAINTLLYASAANTMAALATQNSSVLITSGSGVPSLSTTLPASIAATSMQLTTPVLGTPTSGNLANCTGYPSTPIWAANSNQTVSPVAVNNGYIMTYSGSSTYTLPTTFAVGTVIGFIGVGGAFTVNLGAATNIKAFGNTYTTSFASTNTNDSLVLIGLVANTTWGILSMSSTGFTAS